MIRYLLKSSLILSLGILLGRLVGYVREVFLARKFGASSDSDLIILLLVMPDLVNNLISSGVYNSVYLPRLAKESNEKSRSKLLRHAYQQAFMISAILFFMFSLFLLYFYDYDRSVLLIVAMISVMVNSAGAIAVVKLTFEEKYKLQSIGSMIFNCSFLSFLVLFEDMKVLAMGVVFSALVRTLVLFLVAHRKNNALGFFLSIYFTKYKAIFKDFGVLLASIISYGLIYLNPVIDKIICSKMNTGDISMFNYAEKLYYLPISILITPLAIVSFPRLVRIMNGKDKSQVIPVFLTIILIILFISGLICMLLYFYSDVVVSLVYGRGELNHGMLLSIDRILNNFILAILLSGIVYIGMNLLFALDLSQAALRISILALIINFLGDMGVFYLGGGVSGIAFVTSLVSFFTCCTIYFFLFRELRRNQKIWNI